MRYWVFVVLVMVALFCVTGCDGSVEHTQSTTPPAQADEIHCQLTATEEAQSLLVAESPRPPGDEVIVVSSLQAIEETSAETSTPKPRLVLALHLESDVQYTPTKTFTPGP
jgi:hypothetical protein